MAPTSSLGIRLSLLSTDPAGRPLPLASPRASVAKHPASQSRSILVVLHHLDGFLRPEVAGLLHPAASHEVRRVSRFRASVPTCRNRLVRSAGAFPATLFTPLEELHPTAAVPHRCGRCPLAVASVSSRHLLPVPLPVPGLDALPSGDSTSRLSSAVGSVTPLDRCQSRDALSFRGLCSPSRSFFEPWAPGPRSVRRCRRALPKKHATLDELRSITCTRLRMSQARCLLLAEPTPGMAPRRPIRRPFAAATWVPLPPEGGEGASHRSSILLA